MELLLLLAEHRGDLVSREQIKEKLWGSEVFLDIDNAINTAVRKLRQTLGDDPERPRFVQTVVGRGYRFIASLETPHGPTAALAIPARADVKEQELAAAKEHVVLPGARRQRKPKLVVRATALGFLLLGLAAYLAGPNLHRQKPVMLAVLPFENLSGDPGQEYFSDGLTDETITDLGQLSPGRLGVIARTSAMPYKNSRKTAQQVGHELGVDYILEGSARREGGRVRVSAQLIRVSDQTHVWAQSFDRELHDVLAVQGDLGQAISQRVRVSLSTTETLGLARKRQVDPDAYDLYLRGRYFWNKLTPQDLAKAIAYFQQAIEKDSTYAPAYAGLADCYGTLPMAADVAPTDKFPEAQAAARKAIELDGSLADGYAALVRIDLWNGWNWPALEQDAHRALALNANSADAHLRYAHYLSNAGRHKEALEEVRRARKLDPLSRLVASLQGMFMYYAGQNGASIKELEETVELFPDFWIAHINLGKVYERTRRYDEALKEFARARNLSGSTESLSLAGHTQAVSGNRREALNILAALQDLARHRYVPPYNVALIYAGLGDNSQALDWLEKGWGLRDVHMVFLAVDPKWDGLRTDPRFQSLIRRVGLSQ
jgi:TolB-like protein/DNA-binding winged helix-turn-helix (wHTH) protein/Tfp pilus assembly protein PilF